MFKLAFKFCRSHYKGKYSCTTLTVVLNFKRRLETKKMLVVAKTFMCGEVLLSYHVKKFLGEPS